ncbi:MAG TPA: glycosyltransferase [Solirubrobacteraceae bacterium]
MARRGLVSVVIPVRNERRHLPDQLDALAGQAYDGPFEVVVVDNGSTDGSGDVARSFASRFRALRVVEAPRRGINHARNAGVRAARGEVVAFCDGDDVAAPGWLAALVGALREDVDVVAGALERAELNDRDARTWRGTGAWTEYRLPNGFFQYVPGGNCAMPAAVARRIGWDEDFLFGSSDQEFFLRAQRLGLRIAVAPDAVMRHRLAEDLPELARQFYGYGAGGPLLYRRERGRGLPRSDTRAALREWAGLVLGARRLAGTRAERGAWVRTAALRSGRLIGSVRRGVLYL